MIFLDGQTGAKQKNTVWKPINHFPSDFLGLQVIVTFQLIHSYDQFTCSPFVLVSKLDFFFALPFMKSKRNLCCFFLRFHDEQTRNTYVQPAARPLRWASIFLLRIAGFSCRCYIYRTQHASHHLQLQVGEFCYVPCSPCSVFGHCFFSFLGRKYFPVQQQTIIFMFAHIIQ